MRNLDLRSQSVEDEADGEGMQVLEAIATARCYLGRVNHRSVTLGLIRAPSPFFVIPPGERDSRAKATKS